MFDCTWLQSCRVCSCLFCWGMVGHTQDPPEILLLCLIYSAVSPGCKSAQRSNFFANSWGKWAARQGWHWEPLNNPLLTSQSPSPSCSKQDQQWDQIPELRAGVHWVLKLSQGRGQLINLPGQPVPLAVCSESAEVSSQQVRMTFHCWWAVPALSTRAQVSLVTSDVPALQAGLVTEPTQEMQCPPGDTQKLLNQYKSIYFTSVYNQLGFYSCPFSAVQKHNLSST